MGQKKSYYIQILPLTTQKAPTVSALSTHLYCVRGLSLPISAPRSLQDTIITIWKPDDVEDHFLWQQAINIQTPEPLACLSNFFKLEWVSCPFLTAYYTAFCLLLVICMLPSTHSSPLLQGASCYLLLCYNLTYYTWFFPPYHVPGHQACSSTPFQPHWSVLLSFLIAGNFHSSHSFTFIHSSLLI